LRRTIGLLLVGGGLMLLGAVGADYARGLRDRDAARARWAEIETSMALRDASASLAEEGAPIAPGRPVARILVPHIELDEVVVEGVSPLELNAAPGHIPGTPLPGAVGNSVVSAHRDLHFRRLGELHEGDTLITVTEYRQTRWKITGRRIVRAGEESIFPTPTPTLTLTTCWPIRYIGPAPDRLLLIAEPIEDPPPEVEPRAASVARRMAG